MDLADGTGLWVRPRPAARGMRRGAAAGDCVRWRGDAAALRRGRSDRRHRPAGGERVSFRHLHHCSGEGGVACGRPGAAAAPASPAACNAAFTCAMVKVPKWNTLAASRPVAPGPRALDEVLQRAHAARGDHRQPHRAADRAQQVEVEAAARCRRGPCWSAGSRRRRARRPARHHATASMPVRRRPPWVNTSQRAGAGLLGVDRHDDALAAEFLRRLAHQLGPRHRRGVDAALVGAGQQQPAHVLGRADAAADGQRQEHPRRGARHDVQDRVAVLVAGGDVEEAQLVGALLRRSARPSRPDRRRRAARRS